MAEQYISIKNIADRIMKHPLLSDVTFESMVSDTVDFMRIVGIPDMFIDKIENIEIKNYRGRLPCDFSEIIQLKFQALGNETALRESTDTFHLEVETMPLRFPHTANLQHSRDATFRILNDFIYTSVKEGTAIISYRAINVDEDGFPMLPDSANFMRALESFIKKLHFSILFDLGKISLAVYLKTDQEYAWNVGSCITDMNRMSLPQAESFFNSFSTLIVRASEYKYGFANSGILEQIRRH